MNKHSKPSDYLHNPTAESVRAMLTEQGSVTVWDYYRHYLMPYIGKEEYRYTSVRKPSGNRYVTITQVG